MTTRTRDLPSWRVARFLRIAQDLLDEAARDRASGYPLDFEDLFSIEDQATDWSLHPDVSPRLRTQLQVVAYRTSNLVRSAFVSEED